MKRGLDQTAALLVALATSVVLGAPACGDDASTVGAGASPTADERVIDGRVSVQLVEFRIHADVNAVPAGDVTFGVRNDGDYAHEFKVVKLDLGTTRPPTARDGSLNETGRGIGVIDGIPARRLGPGYSTRMALDLEPGAYLLVCNVVIAGGPFGQSESHYQMGMSTNFTVT